MPLLHPPHEMIREETRESGGEGKEEGGAGGVGILPPPLTHALTQSSAFPPEYPRLEWTA